MAERKFGLFVGAPQNGKSFLAEKLLIQYARAGGCSVVYNNGRAKDFKDFIQVEILDLKEYKKIWEVKNRKIMRAIDLPRQVEWFRLKDRKELYHMKDFCKMFKGKCVKIERIHEKVHRSEDFFIEAVYHYFYNSFVVFDDCRSIFRKGLTTEACRLFSSINHAGKKATQSEQVQGIDLGLIYHGFETVNDETYQWVNRLVQFYTVYEPQLPISSVQMKGAILENYATLNNARKYSHFEYDIYTQENEFFEGPKP